MSVPFGLRLSRRIVDSTVPSQATASLTTVLVTVLAARSTTPAAFGVFAVAQVAVMFAVGLQRAALLTPVLLHTGAGVPAPVKEVRNRVFGVCTVVAVLGAGVGIATSGRTSTAALAIAIAIPTNLYWDSVRAYYQGVRSYRALTYGEGAFFVVAALWFTIATIVRPNLIILVLGLAVAPAVASALTIPPWSSRWISWRKPWPGRDSKNLFADYLVYTGLDQVITLLVAVYLSVLAVGSLRLAQTALGPITVILLALETYTVPFLRDTRATPRRKLHLVGPRFVLVALLAVTAGILLSMSTTLGLHVVGESWVAAAPLVLALAVRQATSAISMIPTLALLTSGATSTIIRCRFLTAPLIAGGALGVLTWRPDVVLFAWTFASLHLVASVPLWVAAFRGRERNADTRAAGPPRADRKEIELTSSTTTARPGAALTALGAKFRHHSQSWRARQRRFQVLRTIPENSYVRFRTKANLLRWRLLLRTPMLSQHFRSVHAKRFAEDLQLLNDVLATTTLRDRYWVWGGLLLGWAREGGILSHDVGDADFFYPEEAEKQLEDAEQALIRADFNRWFCYRRSEDGRVAERVYVRRGSKFEFFRLYAVAGAQSEYHLFGSEGTTPTEYVGRFPQPELQKFEFLDREWLKPADHDDFLTRQYGDWRVPRTEWSFVDDERTLVGRRPWDLGRSTGDSPPAPLNPVRVRRAT